MPVERGRSESEEHLGENGQGDGKLQSATGDEVKPDRAIVTMSSVLCDAVLVADGAASVEALAGNGEAIHYVAEAYRHAKPLGAIGAGIQLLDAAPLPSVPTANESNGTLSQGGVVTIADPNGGLAEFGKAFAQAIAAHRHHDRDLTADPA